MKDEVKRKREKEMEERERKGESGKNEGKK